MTEKRAIVSMAFSGNPKKYSSFTFPLIKAYADKCGADFIVIETKDPQYKYIGHQKWQYGKLLDTYDRILHIDADMIIKPNCPNLFAFVPPTAFAGVDEHSYKSLEREDPYVDRYQDLIEFAAMQGDLINPKFYINVGMYMFSRNHRELFETHLLPTAYFKEQTEINYKLHKNNVDFFPLSPYFNYMSLMENRGLKKEDAYIIHYAGGYRGYDAETVLKMMKDDYVA